MEPISIAILLPVAGDLAKQIVEAGLKQLASQGWKSTYGHPIGVAISSTAEKFSTRYPDAVSTLQRWIESEAFKDDLQELLSGTVSRTQAEHLDRFITESGFKRGTARDSDAQELLTAFYASLRDAYLRTDDGIPIIGANVLSIQNTLNTVVERQLGIAAVIEKIAVSNKAESATCGTDRLNSNDARAVSTLDNARELINLRQIGAAKTLLSTLAKQVEDGTLAADLRLRYFLNVGVCHLMDGQLGAADEAFASASILDPKSEKVLLNRGHVRLLRGEFPSARSFIERVRASSPRHTTATGLYLVILEESGDREGFNRFITENDWVYDDTECLYQLGQIKWTQGDGEQAEFCARRLTEKDPQVPEGWELLGRVLIASAHKNIRAEAVTPEVIPPEILGRIAEARECFDRSLQILQESDRQHQKAVATANRALTDMYANRFQDAAFGLNAALLLDPDLKDVLRNLGVLMLAAGKPSDAVAYFDRITDEKLRRDIAPQVGVAYVEAGQIERARSFLLPAFMESSDPEELVMLADLLLNVSHKLNDDLLEQSLLTRLDTLVDRRPSKGRVLAFHEFRKGRLEQARDLISGAIAATDGVAAKRMQLARAGLLFRAREYSAAADDYEAVLTTIVASAETKRYAAALLNAGRLHKALAICRTVRGDRPAMEDFSEIEAAALESLGELQAAINLRLSFLHLGVTSTHQKLRIAFDYFRMGRLTESAALTREVTLSDASETPRALFEAARLRTLLRIEGALPYAYALLDSQRDTEDAHRAYISTFLYRADVDADTLRPQAVVVDAVVELRFNNQAVHFTITAGRPILVLAS
jgi:tetratricopeptide (TPR) repeat protein